MKTTFPYLSLVVPLQGIFEFKQGTKVNKYDDIQMSDDEARRIIPSLWFSDQGRLKPAGGIALPPALDGPAEVQSI